MQRGMCEDIVPKVNKWEAKTGAGSTLFAGVGGQYKFIMERLCCRE